MPRSLAKAVSCCFPIVGLILYFVWQNERPRAAKAVCQWAVLGVILGSFLYLVSMCAGYIILGSDELGTGFAGHVHVSPFAGAFIFCARPAVALVCSLQRILVGYLIGIVCLVYCGTPHWLWPLLLLAPWRWTG